MKRISARKTLLVLMFVSISITSIVANNEISECEEVKEVEQQSKNLVKKCLLLKTTVIDAPGHSVTIPRDESIKNVMYAYNKHIEYLPDNIYESYPNLTTYDGAACAIKNISKSNFVNLHQLRTIFLDGNLIERIEADVFEGLTMLEEIYLNSNNIKFIDSKAFAGLNNLKRVDLFNNNCISKDFNSAEELETLANVVSNNCQVESAHCNKETAQLKKRIEELEKQLSDKH